MPSKERSLGLREVKVGGLRYEGRYDPAFAVTILQRLAEGELLTDICAEPNMPNRPTVHRWVNLHPEFREAFMAARELSAMAFEERALGLAVKLHSPNAFTGPVIRAYEVAMGQYRWSAARRDPKKYGQQQDIALVVPIQINTTLDLGEGASRGTAEFPDIYTIEAKPVADPLADIDPEDEPENRTRKVPPPPRYVKDQTPGEQDSGTSR